MSAFSGVACVSTRSSTFQVFSFEIGRVSSMRTVSPVLNSFASSWAWYFFDRLMICRRLEAQVELLALQLLELVGELVVRVFEISSYFMA
jgi:hypothetical protein